MDGKTHPCPRCGWGSVNTRAVLSRSANVLVCDQCGTDEALRAIAGNSLPLVDWNFAAALSELDSGVVKVLPCPKCGIDDYVYVVPGDGLSEKFLCICNVCGFNSDSQVHDSEHDAIVNWNERVARAVTDTKQDNDSQSGRLP